MCFVIKNVKRVVQKCTTHVHLSTIPRSQKALIQLFINITCGENVPKKFQSIVSDKHGQK